MQNKDENYSKQLLVSNRHHCYDFSVQQDHSIATRNNWTQRHFGYRNVKNLLKGIYNECLNISNIAVPTAIGQLCQSVLALEDLFFIGNLGSGFLAAAALGNSYTICLSFAASGLTTALDTLISQAYGAKQYSSIGPIVNRAILISSLACIPVGVLFWFAEQIFLLAKQDPLVARLSGAYCKWLIPGLWPLVMLRTLTGYLVNQNMQKNPMLIAIASVLINPVLAYMLVWGVGFKGLGFIGAPIATSLTRIVQLILLLFFIFVFRQYKKTWNGLQVKQTLNCRSIWEFLKLGVPGMLAMILDIWCFEFTSFPAGIVGSNALAAHSIILNIYVVTLMIPMGIAVAGSVRVGMRLGAGSPQKARLSSIISIFMCIVVCGALCLMLYALRFRIGNLMTKDPQVIELIGSTMPIAVSFQIFDAIQNACAGVLRGMGKQVFTSCATLLAYWIIGIPLGLFLAFFKKMRLGLHGLWYGLAIGALFICILQLGTLTFAVNWTKESEKAVRRVVEEEEEVTKKLLRKGGALEPLADSLIN